MAEIQMNPKDIEGVQREINQEGEKKEPTLAELVNNARGQVAIMAESWENDAEKYVPANTRLDELIETILQRNDITESTIDDMKHLRIRQLELDYQSAGHQPTGEFIAEHALKLPARPDDMNSMVSMLAQLEKAFLLTLPKDVYTRVEEKHTDVKDKIKTVLAERKSQSES